MHAFLYLFFWYDVGFVWYDVVQIPTKLVFGPSLPNRDFFFPSEGIN